MTKKGFFLTSAICFLFTTILAQKPNIEVLKTPIEIVLDGKVDEIWNNVDPVEISLSIDGAEPSLSAYWKAVWSDLGIYVIVFVEDDDHFPAWEAGSGNYWEYDWVELFFDVNEVLEDGLGAQNGVNSGHSIFAPKINEGMDGILQNDQNEGGERKYAHKVTGESYIMECFVPFSYLEGANDGMDKYRPIGFDVTVDERDENMEYRLRKTWSNLAENGKESWYNMDGCGTITLSDYILEGLISKKTYIKRTNGTILINGSNSEWANVQANNISLNYDNDQITINKATWKAVWKNEGIYVLVEVEDNNHYPAWEANVTNKSEYDNVELYFDVNQILKDGNGASAGVTSGHSLFAPGFANGKDGQQHDDGTGRLFAHQVNGENYVFEYFIPFSYLNKANNGFSSTRPIGFDVAIVDRDQNSSLGRLRKVWSNNGPEAWINMDSCGTINLLSLEVNASATLEEQLSAANSKIAYLESKLAKGEYYYYDTVKVTVYDTITIHVIKDSAFVRIFDMQEYVTSVNFKEEKVQFKFSPNPAKDYIVLEASDDISECAFYNVQGKLVKKQIINASKANIDLFDFKTGTYFLKITTKKGTASAKMVLVQF